MALSNIRSIYGIHSFTPYDRTTNLPFGTVKLLGESSLTLSGEVNSLRGGSSKFPFDVQDGDISAELTFKPKTYPNFLFEVFLGKAPITNSAESLGSVDTITNKNGTSVVATTGIASVGVLSGSEADLKFTKYIVKVITATTVDVFALSDIDFAKGVDKVFEDDTLKITATPLTITTSTPVTIPDFGLELTGDS